MPTEVALQHCFAIILAVPSPQYKTPFVPPPAEQQEQEGIYTLHFTPDKPAEHYYHSSQVLLIILNHQTSRGCTVLNKAAIHIQSAAKAFVAIACKTVLISFLRDPPPSTAGKSMCLYCCPPNTGLTSFLSASHTKQRDTKQVRLEGTLGGHVVCFPTKRGGATLVGFLGACPVQL